MIIQNKVADQVVDNFLYILEIYKNMRPDLNQAVEGKTCSNNAYQTPNILEYEVFRDAAELILPYIPYDFNLNLFHIHLISYFNSGHQNPHDHQLTEDLSFILYLSDSKDGHTCFFKENTIKIKPEKGKILFFPSDIWHWGEANSGDKKIAVGALKRI